MMTVKTLKKDQNDESFKLFFKSVEHLREKLQIDEPELPRKRKIPTKITDYGTEASAHHHETTEEFYRQIYF